MTSAREKGISVLHVEQNVPAAVEIADRAYVLGDGHVAYTGWPPNSPRMKSRFGHWPVRASRIGSTARKPEHHSQPASFMPSNIFHSDFKPRPYWWEAYEPQALAERDVPKTARVAIIGAGYAGLSAALELAREGLDAVVLDANEPGYGGSTRNGGMVSGGVNVGKRYLARPMPPEEAAPFLNDAADAFTHIEDLIARVITHAKKKPRATPADYRP